MRKALLLLVCVSLLASTVGCFGGFNLVRKVHTFNEDVSTSNWLQELVFLGLVGLPIYGVASIGDAVIFNSVEFWSGSNPIQVVDDKAVNADNVIAMQFLPTGQIQASIAKADGTEETIFIERTSTGFIAKDANGDIWHP